MKENIKLRITGLYKGNSLVTGEFPAQRASDTENSIWWRHHVEHYIYDEHVAKYYRKLVTHFPQLIPSDTSQTFPESQTSALKARRDQYCFMMMWKIFYKESADYISEIVWFGCGYISATLSDLAWMGTKFQQENV